MSSSYRIHEHRSWSAMIYRLFDASWLTFSLLFATLVPHSSHELSLCAAVFVATFALIGEAVGIYRGSLGIAFRRELAFVGVTWVVTVGALSAALLCTDATSPLDRTELQRWLIFQLGGLLASRVLFRWAQHLLRLRGIRTHNYAVVGLNELGLALTKNIDSSLDLGLRFAGYYDDRPEHRLPAAGESARLNGDIATLIEKARRGEIHRIYITFPMRAEKRIRSVLNRLSDSTASVYVVPDFFVFELLHSRWTQIGGLPAVSVFENPFYGVDGMVKRALDLAFGLTIAVFAAVPMALVALGVKLSSPGPIFFRQKRYGLDGKEILVWKFRTMRVMENDAVVKQATRDDPRITTFGKLLRKTSLDELPQLFNVLDGSMSLVGPRPHANAHNEQYRKLIPGYMLRHKVKPGITGLAQVNGWRGETDTDEKMQKRVEFDHRYIREWSPWLDFKILFQTVLTVCKGTNAH
ncbi:MAG: undecaprenyl-phosphate glucose phosphotransferase [Pirellulales bacterium]